MRKSAAAAGMAVLTTLLGACAAPRAPAPPAAPVSSSPSASAAARPEVAASGLVVARSVKDIMFCGGGFGADFTAGPPHCAAWVRASGADLSALADRATARGVTWGTEYLAGTFRAGTLQVSKQGPPRPGGSGPRWVHPPCSPPAGGWATGATSEPSGAAIAAYQRHFPAAVTSVAMFHPGHGTWVVTIASASPARTTARLAGRYPRQLCVVRSRFSLPAVHAARAAAAALLTRSGNGHSRYGVTAVGMTASAAGQPVVLVDAVSAAAALRAALASQPAGLVRIVPWLKPVWLGHCAALPGSAAGAAGAAG